MEIDTQKIDPICPHCEKKLDKLIRVDRGWFKTNLVYCCPECHKIVGLAMMGS